MVPNRPDHRQEIGPGLHQGRAVFCRNPANGDRWDFKHLPPPGQDFRRGTMDGFLAFSREEGTKGNIIRPRFAGFHGKMARSMAGNAQNATIQYTPRCGVVAITLAKMRAITAKFCGKRRVVVQKKRHIPCCRNGHEDFNGTRDFILSRVFQAQLQAGNIARIKRRGERHPKRLGIKPLRGNEIEPAWGV